MATRTQANLSPFLPSGRAVGAALLGFLLGFALGPFVFLWWVLRDMGGTS